MEKVKMRKGIRNFRNTCFMNVVFQCLIGIKEVREGVSRILEVDEQREALLFYFKGLVGKVEGDEKCLEPKELVNECFGLFKGVRPNTQQDAQEFFYLFIDKLNFFLEQRKETSVLKELFYGETRKIIHCVERGSESLKFKEEFLQISLPILNICRRTLENRTQEEIDFLEDRRRSIFCKIFRGKNLLTVQDCIREYFSNFKKTYQDQCMLCEKSRTCKVKLEICKSPEYLVLCLKRFIFDHEVVKLNNRIYALEKLTLFECSYELISVVQHAESFRGPHYCVYCKEEAYWVKCNDTKVKRVSTNKVINAQPYMMVYKRISETIKKSFAAEKDPADYNIEQVNPNEVNFINPN